MAHPRFLLDASGEVPAPIGHEIVGTEAEFLRQATGPAALLVRGPALCRWAEEFCSGRDYVWETVRPATEWLRLYCPALTEAEAHHIHGMLTLGRPAYQEGGAGYRVWEVLESLFPEGPWAESPGREHAARWLLWLEGNAPDPALRPLLAQTAAGWALVAPEEIAPLYAIHDEPAARMALAAWLGVTDTLPGREAWGDFPLAVPARWRTQARALWSADSVAERPRLLTRVQERRAPYDIRVEAARMAAEYFQHHARDLTAPVLASLEALLPEATAARLRALCPPPPPAPLPDSVDGVLEWFVGQYLPYRLWEQEHGDEAARKMASERGAEFESWCLRFYPAALAGASEHLAIRRSQRLQQRRAEGVTLWIVFDGLTYPDGQTMARLLAEEPRLSLVSLTPVLSLLPTITKFCKNPLIEGLPSGSVDEARPVPSWDGARRLERNREPETALARAEQGDVFVWPLTQPDKTYHERFDGPTVRRNVQSELERWAGAIRDGARAVPAHLPLRVVFTTDHGRLLSAGTRTLEVPEGMEAHGRAAYGRSGRVFGATGTLRDEAAGLVFLDKDRFRLPTDCAVALGSSVFKTSDGKTGQEWFPHGGLSPEEVLIPWGELTRDLAPPLLRTSLSGRGRSGATSRAQIHLENLGTVPVRAVAVALTVGTETRVLAIEEIELGPLSSAEVSVEVPRWPTAAQTEGARAAVEILLPGGSRISVEARVALQTQEMQGGRAASLEDL